jgi:RNA polymerase sigma-70 factor, ECF subfamily
MFTARQGEFMRTKPPDRESEGFEAFFRAEHPRLVAIGLALTGDREAARDLAAEALSRAHRSWPSLDNPSAWVRRVITNLATDRGRRLGRERRVLSRVAAQTPSSTGMNDPVSDGFWAAVRALPERQQAAVVLHYLEDRSILDVASILGVAEGTVKSTLFKARNTLATTLAAEVQ